MKTTNKQVTRLIFFDNLRYLMILLVIVFHAGASYGTLPAFWPYRDPKPIELVMLIMMILDTFMMSVLFFHRRIFYVSIATKKGWRRISQE